MPEYPMPAQLQAMIFDLDGVVWRDQHLLPGVQSLFPALRNRGIAYAFATNNSTSTPESICASAGEIGFEIHPNQVITSALATLSLLEEQLEPGATILMIGEEGLAQALQQAGYQLTARADQAQAVVVGFDREATWTKFAEAAYALERGVPYIGTNLDPSFPTARGLAPGNGALLKLLEHTTGIQPRVAGKPEPYIFEVALDRLSAAPGATILVGDRLETDIAGGQEAGMLTALVMTGVTNPQQLAASKIEPTYIFEDLVALQHRLLEA